VTVSERNRRAAWAALAVAVLCFAFVFASKEVPALAAHSPWADDPYDAVVSYALVLIPAATAVALIRLRRHAPPPVAIPAHARAQIRRASTLALALALVAVASTLAASLAGAGRATRDSRTASMITIAGFAFLACLGACWAIAGALRYDDGHFEPGEAPDLIDDLQALLVPTEGATAVRLRLARALAAAADVRLGVRHHPRLWAGGLAILAGTALDGWHAWREGPWANVSGVLVFGALGACNVLVLALLSSWLMLVRPTPSGR
jgi:hypothetical protein